MMNQGPSAKDDEAIVNPVSNARSPQLGPVAILVSPKADLSRCLHRMPWLGHDFSRLYLSRLYIPKTGEPGPSLVGPMIGAPYAAMILETLIAWGCRQFIFLGWCGAVDENVRTGDLIIPSEAVIDEGTSPHYLGADVLSVKSDPNLTQMLFQSVANPDVNVHKGLVWSTDAVFRETRSAVSTHQQAGVLGVEMEFSSLLSVGRYRSVDVAGVLVVSDELSTLNWQPGFKSAKFKKGRAAALEGIIRCIRKLRK